MFLPVTTRTGALRVRWEPFDSAECRVWLLLADPATLRPDDLHPERLLQHMIRLPVDPRSGSAVVHTPVGRTVGLCIVWRDANDEPQSTLPSAWSEEVLASAPTAPREPQKTLPTPPDPAPSPPPPRPSPLPLAQPTATAPAPTLAPSPKAPTTADPPAAIAALAARLMANAPPPPPRTPPPAGFGLQQPWYLGHLSFPAETAAPRLVVRRTTFIQATDLQAWREAPPADAMPLPDRCNTIIDAIADVGETAFYAVLEGPGPWRSLPLVPLGPPFSGVLEAFVFGNARARLDAAIEAALARGADPMVLEILDAARASC